MIKIRNIKKKGQFNFDSMQLGLKIMPSYNTENNVIFMDKVNDVYKNNKN